MPRLVLVVVKVKSMEHNIAAILWYSSGIPVELYKKTGSEIGMSGAYG